MSAYGGLDDVPGPITAIGFTTGFGSTGIFQNYRLQTIPPVPPVLVNLGPPITQCSSKTINAPNLYQYIYIDDLSVSDPELIAELHFTFQVQAGHDGIIGLQAATESLGFEIVIGGWSNTRSAIREGALPSYQELNSATTTDILSNSDSRWFWIRVTRDTIAVGKGQEVGNNTFMSHEGGLDHVPISRFAVTDGYGTGGVWKNLCITTYAMEPSTDVQNVEACSSTTPTTPDNNGAFLNQYVRDLNIGTMTGFDYLDVTFEVQAKSNAYIILQPAATGPSTTPNSLFEILIGGYVFFLFRNSIALDICHSLLSSSQILSRKARQTHSRRSGRVARVTPKSHMTKVAF